MLNVTRESRLAVVIGFSLVLVVGVLISDHLSRARQADPGPGITDAERETLEPVRLLKDPPRNARGDTEPTPNPAPDEIAQPTAPKKAPLETDQTATQSPQANGSTSPLGSPAVLTLGETNEDRDARPSTSNRPIPLFVPVSPNGNDNRAETAEPRWHTVSEGETLYAIAERYLGDGNRWREIARANTARVGDDGDVRTGVRLRLPDNAANPARPATTAANTTADAQPRTAEYTIKPGEVFSVLAQRFMGTVRRQDDLLELNRGRIDDPDDIRAGMTILVPTQPPTGD